MGEDLIENEIYVAKLFGSDLQGNDLYKLEPLKQIGNATFVKVTPEFKRGDILKSTITPELTVIFDEKTSITAFDSIYHNNLQSRHCWSLKKFRHATEEEKQKFFDELKAQGKWWNAEAMEIEDISKFKEGDFVYEDGRIMIAKNHPNNYYALIYPKLDMKPIYNGRYAPTMSLSSLSFRYATEDEKQLLIDAMKKDGKRWNAEKLTIEDIPQPKFKAGDKVTLKSGCTSKSDLTYISAFDEYIGKELIVIDYTEEGNVRCNNSFCFAEDWLEPYVEELKKDDLAIFWDDNYLNPLIRLYNTKTHSGNSHIDNHGTIWDNAVKWDGTKEQFEKILNGEI